MDVDTVRLWATEELGWWPNRLHVLAVVVWGVLLVAMPSVAALVIEVVLVGWLAWRIHLWDRLRRRLHPLRVKSR